MAIALIVTIVFVALVIYGLERNARRQAGPRSPLSGSPNAPDRDLQRVRDELIVLGSRDRSAN
jgi:hypothetical protein